MLDGYNTLNNDYASERETRRRYQQSVNQMQREAAEIKRQVVCCPFCLVRPRAADVSQEDHSFVLALIDGDGVIVSRLDRYSALRCLLVA